MTTPGQLARQDQIVAIIAAAGDQLMSTADICRRLGLPNDETTAIAACLRRLAVAGLVSAVEARGGQDEFRWVLTASGAAGKTEPDLRSLEAALEADGGLELPTLSDVTEESVRRLEQLERMLELQHRQVEFLKAAIHHQREAAAAEHEAHRLEAEIAEIRLAGPDGHDAF